MEEARRETRRNSPNSLSLGILRSRDHSINEDVSSDNIKFGSLKRKHDEHKLSRNRGSESAVESHSLALLEHWQDTPDHAEKMLKL
eukprot:CAMPEP_0115025978 /NCGR_PEP_ID=MMETSP0216-20121206/34405_1 /TAXON_ID=223996 /ORGANISM="Protocruzia adherens, Strain Boccale" /LENGTH=85 /DNA_ID=CAMNT_0002400831 /DNA_START=596 /DNA_END=853 /DNA_ORIENTATION=-